MVKVGALVAAGLTRRMQAVDTGLHTPNKHRPRKQPWHQYGVSFLLVQVAPAQPPKLEEPTVAKKPEDAAQEVT